ncbi:MAG: hypothetical protein KAT30_09785, partial [Candidatus Krumholzibacteria bacterium]|nr:hypothetical protein [Candidatus Krumholzibacteria bacterium]
MKLSMLQLRCAARAYPPVLLALILACGCLPEQSDLSDGGTVAVAIQRLIDEARPGDVVEVPPGKYAGPLRITKPLTLRGESAEKCVIEFLG